MKKIPSLFQRNYDGDRLVRDEVVPGSEWVLAGEGVATRKWDGTCCMVAEGVLYKRHDVKKGKTAPAGFIPAQDPDEVTGHWPGWVRVGDGPEDKLHRETFAAYEFLRDGTYELVGPKVNGNPERFGGHHLLPHGVPRFANVPRSFDGLRDWLAEHDDVEGIVWHHPDGRMVKIKGKDFGLRRSARDGGAP